MARTPLGHHVTVNGIDYVSDGQGHLNPYHGGPSIPDTQPATPAVGNVMGAKTLPAVPKVTGTAGGPGGGFGTQPPADDPNALPVQPGLDWLQTEEGIAMQKYVADLQAKSDGLTRQNQLDIAGINAAAQARSDANSAALQRELQAGQITADEYMQKQSLAEQNIEFTKNLALQTRAQQHQEDQDAINTQLAKAQEVRQERELQATLASDPADFVKYEMYKRQLGQPQTFGTGDNTLNTQGGVTPASVASTTGGFMNAQGTQAPGGVPSDAGNPATGQQQSGAPTQQSGGEGTVDTTGASYPAAPGAYSDATLQQVAASIFGGNQAPYNPNLAGKGAFGADIQNPNSISRAEFGNMDPSDLSILSSFLTAGVQTDPNDPNSRVSVDPSDYFNQVQKSWIPTLQQTQTSYA